MDKKKVLVVDDEIDFLEITKLNLEGTGRYEVLALSTAKDIMNQVHKFKPDIILLDMLMPTAGGIEVCEMLNSDPIGKKIPIVILSALDKDEDKLKAYKVGVVGYLTKPIRRNDLIAKIDEALRFK